MSTACGAKTKLRMADGGEASPWSIRGIYNKLTAPAPAETISQKYARQDAERAAKNPAPVAPPTPPTPAASAPAQGGITGYAADSTLKSRLANAEKTALGMKDGGQLQTGKGGAVPGKGKGDKIDAKYEPGEFVVSNAMLAAKPGLREQLHALRNATLQAQGTTPEQADAKQFKGGKIRALTGDGSLAEIMKNTPQSGMGVPYTAPSMPTMPSIPAPVNVSSYGAMRKDQAPDVQLPGPSIKSMQARYMPPVAPAATAPVPHYLSTLAQAHTPEQFPGAPAITAAPAPATPTLPDSMRGPAVVNPEGVTLNGQVGNNVAGAPGVSKFVQNGKTTYSNVTDAQGGNEGKNQIGIVPGMNPALIKSTLTNPDGSQWRAGDNATMAANLRDGNDPYTGTSRAQSGGGGGAVGNWSSSPSLIDTVDNKVRSGSIPAWGLNAFGQPSRRYLAYQAQTEQNAATLAGHQLTANATMAGRQLDANTQTRGQDLLAQDHSAIRDLAQKNYEMQKDEHDVKNSQAKTIKGLLDKYMSATDPAAKAAAAGEYRIASGHEAKEIPELWGTIDTYDANGMKTGQTLYNKRTGEKADGAKQTPLPNHIAALQKDPKLAANFDIQYGAGAAAKYLGAK